MATTENLHTGDASKTKFSFTFPYLNQTDVEVYKYVTNAWVKQTITTHYTFDNATTIKFGSAPAAATTAEQTNLGDTKNIKIQRNTSGDSLAATFYPGSAIRSGDLNDNFTQNLYVTQEASNAVTDANTDAAAAVVTADEAKTLATTADGNATTALNNSRLADGATPASPSGGYTSAIYLADQAKTTATTASNNATTAVNTANAAFQRDGSAKMTGDIVFDPDGASHETTLTVAAPSGSNKTITLPNVTGTVVTTGDTGTVTSTMITDGTIAAGDIATGAVTTAKLAADAVTAAKIADDVVNSEHYAAASVDTEHIADLNITTAKLAADAVTDVKIADNAVTIAKVGCEQTTITDSDSHVPTSGAVVDYVAGQLAPIGGFTAIATDAAFPATASQPANGVIMSISDAQGVVINGSGVSTTGRTTDGTPATVTINGFPSSLYSETLAAGVGLMVSSTGSSNTYTYHKLLAAEGDVKQLSDDINDFNARYRVNAGEPGSANDEGDLCYDTSANKMKVYDGSAWGEVTSTGDYKHLFLSPEGSTGAPTFNGSIDTYDLREVSNSGSSASVTSAAQLLVSVNGVIQKPNTGTSAPSEGFALEDSHTIVFGANLPTGAEVFVTQVGTATTLNVPADSSVTTAKIAAANVTTAKIADLNVTTAKIAADAVTGAKIADDAIDSEHYTDGSIDTAHIADANVTTAKIADANVTTAKIADANVTTAKIADDAVTAAKLANAINTDIAAKAPLASPTFTGTVTTPIIDVDGAYKQTVKTITQSATPTVDLALGNYFTLTQNANVTSWTFSNAPASRSFSFVIELANASYSTAWSLASGTVKWPADTAPTLAASKTHLIIFVTDDGGTTYRASSLVDYTT